MWSKIPRHGALIALFLASGCAESLPPRELVDARAAYTDAANGAAGRSDRPDLETARAALDRAEESFDARPESDATRDLAYIAAVKARTAEERGRLVESERARAITDAQFKVIAENKLDSRNATIDDDKARLEATSTALTSEVERRAALEKRLRDAMDRLSKLAMVKSEQRGTVITLSGSVLFASDRSDLLPSATERLNDVAEALMAQPDRSVSILGFTDSRGDTKYNQELSQRRAIAVRAFLVARGVDPKQLTAEGKGPADPVADNGSAEGRANNRRVEIVIAPGEDEHDVY
ncbi:MAG: OmpA family protein [Polyangiaceae bacterium]